MFGFRIDTRNRPRTQGQHQFIVVRQIVAVVVQEAAFAHQDEEIVEILAVQRFAEMGFVGGLKRFRRRNAIEPREQKGSCAPSVKYVPVRGFLTTCRPSSPIGRKMRSRRARGSVVFVGSQSVKIMRIDSNSMESRGATRRVRIPSLPTPAARRPVLIRGSDPAQNAADQAAQTARAAAPARCHRCCAQEEPPLLCPLLLPHEPLLLYPLPLYPLPLPQEPLAGGAGGAGGGQTGAGGAGGAQTGAVGPQTGPAGWQAGPAGAAGAAGWHAGPAAGPVGPQTPIEPHAVGAMRSSSTSMRNLRLPSVLI